ncbi:hypothetical protein GC722_08950 [Auraticoccus sp. F435]|uniref:Nitrate/nitrite sensing protein domain-containing protein n=1 Tax=Auraticoccus cholistanensis TaxID=2656650 RepID=A0A6A9V0S6_9ACTN|nr:hypothetical protein [Auraticoccus cholistanensis]MVA76149.1 hypothetical protein [Auraticoccus cholistanensis]
MTEQEVAERPRRAAQPLAPQASAPGYLQQRVAFPAPTVAHDLPPQVITRPGRVRDVGRRGTRLTTPQLLTVLTTACVLTVLLLGTVATTFLVRGADALQRARHDAQQLVRVQQIEADLLRADALAASSFLVGASAGAQDRADHAAAVDEVSRLLVEAARAQPADAPALQEVNSELVRYTAAVAQARAQRGSDRAAAAAALQDAGARLRSTAVPRLEATAEANAARVGAGVPDLALVAVPAVALLTLAVLGWTLRTVAVRFHRRVNVGLAAAAVLVLLGGAVPTAVLASAAGVVADLDRGALADVRQLSAARASAHDARALEGLALVSPGAAAGHEDAWQQRSEQVLAALHAAGAQELVPAWQRHLDAHRQIRTLADRGDRTGAVAAATGQGEGSSRATAEEFQTALAPVLARDVAAADAALTRQRGVLLAVVAGSVLATAAAGAAALAGLRARAREYE